MSDPVEQSLYFPEPMLVVMQNEAARQDKSLSWCAQKAWRLSRSVFSKLPSFAPGAEELPTSPALEAGQAKLRKQYPTTADKRKQTLFFPEEMAIELREEAARLDRSMSWIVQIAWCLAESEILSSAVDASDSL